MHLRDSLTDAEYRASRVQDNSGCVGGDSYDQKMLWEEIVEKRDQLALRNGNTAVREEACFNKRVGTPV